MLAALWTRAVSTGGPSSSCGRLVPLLFHPYALFLIVALAVWMPDGFRIGDTNDGWLQMGTVLQTHGALRSNIPRMFGGVPMWLGMHLDPGGFVGLQVIMLVFTLFRGVLLYEIAARLVPGSRFFALAAGLVAEFQPADRSYFWLGASGLHLAFVAALAGSLFAIVHLHSRSRGSLITALAFQFLSGFTYPGFIPLMTLLPVGAWVLKRLEGETPGPLYLIKMNAVVAIAIVADLVMMHYGKGRDTAVADLNLQGALAGFGWAATNLVRSPFLLSHGMHSYFWLPAALAALFGLGTATLGLSRPGAPASIAPPLRRHTAFVFAGLVGLALLSYLPYSIATVRFLPDRTLLGAGIFGYGAVLLLLFALLPELKTLGRPLAPAAVVFLTGLCVVTGLVKRDFWVQEYRQQEHLLSSVASALPHPPSGSFILVHLQDPADAHLLRGFTTREAAFIVALRYLYSDMSLNGGFVGFDANRVVFSAEGMHTRKTMLPNSDKLFTDYAHLIAVDYFPADSAVKVLDRDWLAREAGLKPETLKYVPPAPASASADGTRICTMLEPKFRPDYCR